MLKPDATFHEFPFKIRQKLLFLLLPNDSYVICFDDDLNVEGESRSIVLVPFRAQRNRASVLQLFSSITLTRIENVF